MVFELKRYKEVSYLPGSKVQSFAEVILGLRSVSYQLKHANTLKSGRKTFGQKTDLQRDRQADGDFIPM